MKWNNSSWQPKEKYVQNYLVTKNNLMKLIVFTAIFSFGFINIYQPFGSDTWYNITHYHYIFFSLLLVLTGIAVISVSRIIMYHVTKRHPITYWIYAIWIIAEIVVLSFIYTVYTIEINHQRIWELDNLVSTFNNCISNTFLIILLPYAIAWLYMLYDDARTRLQNFEESEQGSNPAVIQFCDEKGEPRLSVTSNNIISLEAADNYVVIRYKNLGKISSYLLRNTLKKISETTLKDTNIRRCHRSYMVNFEHVIALRKSSDGGLLLELDEHEIGTLPVSKSYNDEITEHFLVYAGQKKNQPSN